MGTSKKKEKSKKKGQKNWKLKKIFGNSRPELYNRAGCFTLLRERYPIRIPWPLPSVFFFRFALANYM